MGMSDSTSTDALEVTASFNTNTNQAIGRALYDPLTRFDPISFAVVNWLAEECEPGPDASYWTVRVRDAEFHDGRPVRAEDVAFTIRRNLDPKQGSIGAQLLTAIDPQRLTKMDSRTLRVYLKYPDVSISQGLAFLPCAIVPVGYDPKNPIGTGPFRLSSFHPGARSSFVRNDTYWQAGRPYLDEVVLVGFADPGTTRINALNNGEIDGADHILPTLAPTIQSGTEVLVSKAGTYISWEMRSDIPPFNDVRVRQAVKLIADRGQIVEQALGGSRYSTVANDLGGYSLDPLYDRSLPQRTQDIPQAKALLKQAGRQNLTVELVVSNVTPGVVETAQVLAQQAQAAGLTIKVNNVADAATYFAKYYVQAPFKFDYWGTQTFWLWVDQALTPGSPYFLTNWHDEQFLKLVGQARSETNLSTRKEIAAAAQRLVWDTGPQGIFGFSGTIDAHSPRFAGFQTDVTGDGLNGLQFGDIYAS